jgi:hypothetical protein
MQITSTNRVVVEPGGAGVVAHVGLHALGAFADRLGLSHLLSSRIVPRGERLPVHDRGKVLTQMALVVAGGGESCADIEHLRLQSDLFGHVASDSTVHRTFHELDNAALAELAMATAQMRTKVWDRLALTSGTGPVLLDIDASLIEVHSENKVGAAPNYEKGYGLRPMLCFADATGEALSAILRPGNATANTVADHVRVLDGAIEQLPVAIASGHHVGEADETPTRSIVVRADSAGCTTGFLSTRRARHVRFFVTARSYAQVINAVFDAQGCDVWLAATT